MLDIGHDFKQIHPDWFDTMRLTKLPSFEDEFGRDNRTFAGVRQSRLGVRSSTPTDFGDLKTTFEFELFGTGIDSGQTTFRLRHAYGELGAFGAGQTWSPFMDPDVFPNSLEYWGPTGMVFFRNVQLRWMPIKGDTSLTLALARPGASADQGGKDAAHRPQPTADASEAGADIVSDISRQPPPAAATQRTQYQVDPSWPKSCWNRSGGSRAFIVVR
jgi:hypothetical protein